MEKSYDTCDECKYDYLRHCTSDDSCRYCELYDGHCKCLSINYGEDCPYFVKAEEVDNNGSCTSNCQYDERNRRVL